MYAQHQIVPLGPQRALWLQNMLQVLNKFHFPGAVMDQNGYGYGMQPQDAPPAAYIPREMFSVGEVLGIKIWLKNFVPFTLITLICFTPLAVWLYASGLEKLGTNKGTLLLTALSTISQSVATGAITYGVVMSLRKTPASLVDCFGKGMSRMLPSIVVGIVAGLCVGVATIALIVPGLIVACVLYVAVPASVIESPGIGGALSRSAELTRGHRWGIFGLAIIVGVAALGLTWVNEHKVIPSLVTGSTSLSMIKFKAVLSLLLQYVLTATFAGVMASVTYYLLRSEKEGTNIDQIGSVFD
jgi:hypothetical protein